jgi:hypothetical protein
VLSEGSIAAQSHAALLHLFVKSRRIGEVVEADKHIDHASSKTVARDARKLDFTQPSNSKKFASSYAIGS